MKNIRLFWIFIYFALLVFPGLLHAQTYESVIVHTKVSNLIHGQGPLFVDRKILFSYENKRYIRRVGIAFGYENYRTVYPFSKNNNNIFVYVADVPPGMDYIDYRIIVDGLWINDPENPNSTISREGFRISRLDIPDYLKHKAVSPQIGTNRTVRFIYTGQSGQNIYLSGNFNNWDPFMLKMHENSKAPGVYSIAIRIPSGSHYYTFIADGKEMTDPENPNRAIDKSGRRVSLLLVP